MFTDLEGVAVSEQDEAIATKTAELQDDKDSSLAVSSEDASGSDSSDDYNYSLDSSDDNDWGLAGQGNDPGFWVTYP